jgi:glucuronosyltransferase
MIKIFVLFLLINFCFALNILIVSPAIGHSHVQFAGKIANVLIDGGHNVTILEISFDPDVTEVGTERAHTIRYYSESVDYSGFLNLSCKSSVFTPSRKAASDVPMVFEMYKKVCNALVNDNKFWEELNSTKWDIGMTEFVDNCPDGIFEVLKIGKVVMISAVTMFNPTYEAFGIPFIASFMPNMFLPFSDKMTWKQKLLNLYVNYKLNDMFTINSNAQTEMFRKKFDPNFENLLKLRQRKAAITFINTNQFLDVPTLITNKIKYVGGMEVKNAAPINQRLMKIIESSKGFVILSFGTFARSKSVPIQIRNAISMAFKNFPEHTFFWKFDVEDDEIPEFLQNSTNIYLEKWLPQHSMLNHPKCKGFISHAGYNSILEATLAAVPMILVPLFGDQPHNAAVVHQRGLGILLGRENLHEVGITLALKELLKEPQSIYHKNAIEFSQKMKEANKILSPEETVLKYTEYIYKYGNLPELNLASTEISVDLEFYWDEKICMKLELH